MSLESQMRGEVGEKCRKFVCHDVRSIGPTYRLVDDYVSSPEFARVMERVTGIQNLLYDPGYHGGGTHDNLPGQGMLAHVDFNLHHTTGYHRRCNAIIYLNKEWNEQWGGNLELHTDPWDFENDQIVSYPPLCAARLKTESKRKARGRSRGTVLAQEMRKGTPESEHAPVAKRDDQ